MPRTRRQSSRAEAVVPQDTLDKKFQSLKPYAPEIISGFAETMRKYAENVILRI